MVLAGWWLQGPLWVLSFRPRIPHPLPATFPAWERARFQLQRQGSPPFPLLLRSFITFMSLNVFSLLAHIQINKQTNHAESPPAAGKPERPEQRTATASQRWSH